MSNPEALAAADLPLAGSRPGRNWSRHESEGRAVRASRPLRPPPIPSHHEGHPWRGMSRHLLSAAAGPRLGNPGRRSNGDTGRSGPRLNLGALPLLGGGPVVHPGAPPIAIRNQKAPRPPRLCGQPGAPVGPDQRLLARGLCGRAQARGAIRKRRRSDRQPTPPGSQVNGLGPHVPRTRQVSVCVESAL
jgi:hypothetical protein